MGRQKQNKPRRERSIGPGNAIAGMLDLPSVISHGETGVILDVAAVGLAGDDLADDRPAYVRLSGGSVKLLPEGLRPWARDVVARELNLRAAGEPSLFPCRIGFGVTEGGAYAELL